MSFVRVDIRILFVEVTDTDLNLKCNEVWLVMAVRDEYMMWRV
jgi:hypothetical protein